MRFLISEKLSPHKYKTPEGYLICTDAVLSRTGKQEYRRCELFGDACDNAEEIVQVNREDSEVFSDKAMASFENKPVCIQHPDVDVNSENHNELAVGFVRDIHKGVDNGQPVMLGTLVITNKEAVDDIESGKYKELSCGYDCDVSEDDLSQRNIRGNHVALCEQGRAGIARIVDSVDDARLWGQQYPYELWLTYPKTGRKFMAGAFKTHEEARRNTDRLRKEFTHNVDGIPNAEIRENFRDSVKDVNDLTKFKMALRNISKMYSNDPGIEYVTSTLKNLGYEVVIDSIDGWKENKNVPGEHIKQYRMNVMLEGREHHFLVQLYADMGKWEVKEINAYMLDSVKDTRTREQIQADIDVIEREIDWCEDHNNMWKLDDLYKILDRLQNELKGAKDSMKDADFSKKSKQGYDVIEMYRDGSRLHAILKRANDYVVAYGYDTTDGTWAQGRYVDKYANAKATLFEEKPYAKKIQDAIKDDSMTYKKYNDKISSFIFDKKKLEAIVKEIQSEPGLLGGEKSALIMKANSYINDLERMEDSVYTVKYTKDDVTYIRKVKANSMSDAIAKATHD